MAATYPSLLASGITLEGTFLPFELFGGESDIVSGEVTASGAIAQFAVLMRNTDGTASVWNGTGYPGDGAATVLPVPFAIAATAIADGATGPVFLGGVFNPDALVWPGGVTTLANRKRAFDGTNIVISRPLGVNTGITYS